jgi:hypothetical protein
MNLSHIPRGRQLLLKIIFHHDRIREVLWVCRVLLIFIFCEGLFWSARFLGAGHYLWMLLGDRSALCDGERNLHIRHGSLWGFEQPDGALIQGHQVLTLDDQLVKPHAGAFLMQIKLLTGSPIRTCLVIPNNVTCWLHVGPVGQGEAAPPFELRACLPYIWHADLPQVSFLAAIDFKDGTSSGCRGSTLLRICTLMWPMSCKSHDFPNFLIQLLRSTRWLGLLDASRGEAPSQGFRCIEIQRGVELQRLKRGLQQRSLALLYELHHIANSFMLSYGLWTPSLALIMSYQCGRY